MAEKHQTAQIAIVVVLGIVLTAVLLIRFDVLPIGSGKTAGPGASAKDKAPGTSPAKTPAAAETASAGTQAHWERPGSVRVGIRDPMQLDTAKLPAEQTSGTQDPAQAPIKPAFRVTGIIFNVEQSSSVIIDGQILYEGSTIHGATVAKISEKYAELSRGDKKWLVRPGQSNPEPE